MVLLAGHVVDPLAVFEADVVLYAAVEVGENHQAYPDRSPEW